MRAHIIFLGGFLPCVLASLRLPHRQHAYGKTNGLNEQTIHHNLAQRILASEPVWDNVSDQQQALVSAQYSTDDPKGIRVQEVGESICKSGARQLTGHINVTEHKSLFFWFHESRRDPENDPLILWLNGGPGASSLMGALTELGPCLIDDDGKNTTYNPHSWSNFANIIFLDQPAGVGFSTVTNDSFLPYTVEVAATDFSTFIRRLFKHVIPEFASHKVHLMGESFAGVYLPGFLSKIIEQQHRLEELGLENPFPEIESLVLADGLVDWATNSIGLYATTCLNREDETGVEGPVLNSTACEELSKTVSDCERLGNECRSTLHGPTCSAAFTLCYGMGDSYWDIVHAGKRSPYDMRADCPDKELCLDYFEKRMDKYLNQPQVLEELGLPNTTVYVDTNMEVNRRWTEWGFDTMIPSLPHISQILQETDVRVLIYNGNSDWCINSPGVVEWMNIIPWSSNGEFRALPLKPWDYTDDEGQKRKAGMMKRTRNGRLGFAGIDNAGHLAPYDQPAALETLIKRWLDTSF